MVYRMRQPNQQETPYETPDSGVVHEIAFHRTKSLMSLTSLRAFPTINRGAKFLRRTEPATPVTGPSTTTSDDEAGPPLRQTRHDEPRGRLLAAIDIWLRKHNGQATRFDQRNSALLAGDRMT